MGGTCDFRGMIFLRGLATAALFATVGAHAGQAVKVGVSGPLTGSSAQNGKDIENGARMALDEANAQHMVIGGQEIQFELESVDDQGDPRVGVLVAQKLVDDKVAVAIGHYNSGVCLPASKVLASGGVPLIDPAATNPMITQQGLSSVLRIIATDSQNSGNAGKYAVTVTKAKRIAVMDDRTAFGQGETDEFKKAVIAAGGTIVATEYTNDKAVDFSAQLTNLKRSTPDLLFFGGLDSQAAEIAKRMKQLGMTAQFLGGGAVADTIFTKIAGPAGEGAMAWEYGTPLERLPKGKEFASKYKAKFGVTNLTYSPFAYDATWLAITAMKEANSVTPVDFIPKLKNASYGGVTGQIAFDARGDLQKPTSTLYQVKNGVWQPVTTIGAN